MRPTPFRCKLSTCGDDTLLGACGRGAKNQLDGGVGAFRDVTVCTAGIAFRYDNDATPAHRFIETTGGGCAFVDYDNDGLLDIFAVQGGPAPGSAIRVRPPCALYHNMGGGRFVDVTAQCGLALDLATGRAYPSLTTTTTGGRVTDIILWGAPPLP